MTVNWKNTLGALEAKLATAAGADRAVGQDLRSMLYSLGSSYDARLDDPKVQAQLANYQTARAIWLPTFYADLDKADSVSRWVEGKQIAYNQAIINGLYDSALGSVPSGSGIGAAAALFGKQTVASQSISGLDATMQNVGSERIKLDPTTPTLTWLAVARSKEQASPNGKSEAFTDEALDDWQLQQVQARLARAATLPVTSAEDRAVIAQYKQHAGDSMATRPTFGTQRIHPRAQTIREQESDLVQQIAKANTWLAAL